MERQKGSGIATFLSILYVAAALALLLGVCGWCYPEFSQRAKEVLRGWENGQVRQAFSTLAEGLEAGEPVKETLSESIEVLLGEEN